MLFLLKIYMVDYRHQKDLEYLMFRLYLMFLLYLMCLMCHLFLILAGALGRVNLAQHLLVLSSGVITAVPLLLFAYGARRVRLSTLGLLQYIAPSVQLAIGVAVYHEVFSHERAVSFAFIWAGLALYTADNLWMQRRALR